MSRTINALRAGGFQEEASMLEATRDREVWEHYARDTFIAHVTHDYYGKLRFLQYVTPRSRAWWAGQKEAGAILL
jgi:hypothetical protein